MVGIRKSIGTILLTGIGIGFGVGFIAPIFKKFTDRMGLS